MIAANHAAWADWMFHPYLLWLFKRHFYAIHLLGKPPNPEVNLPLLLLPNHSTWWDGFFVYLLNKKIFHRRVYLMMLEEQLVRYRFFSRLGAFSVDPRSPASVRKSLHYASDILRQPTSPPPMLCIFPQGELLPWGRQPLEYKRGIEALARMYGDSLNVLPLAIKTEFLNEQKAEAFFLFGESKNLRGDTFPDLQTLQHEEEKLLAELAARLDRGEKGTLLFGSSGSAHSRKLH